MSEEIPALSPLLVLVGYLIVTVGFLVIGMVVAVIRLHARALRRQGASGRRLLVWHVLLISSSQVLFILPLIFGMFQILGVLDTPQELRWGSYLLGLAVSALALILIAARLRPRHEAPPLNTSAGPS